MSDSITYHFHIRYFTQLVLYQILTLLQVLLVISTVLSFHRKSKNSKLSDDKLRIYNQMKYLFISVLTMGSLVLFLVEWYGIADFLYDFAVLPHYCDIAAILGNLSLLTYLLTLYLFYLYRLWATFNNSAFRLSQTTITTLLITTFSTYFIMIIIVFIFQKGAVKHTPFSWTLQPSQYKPIIICAGEFSIGINPILRIALQCIVIIGNTFYGCIFYKKLYDLLSFMDTLNDNNNNNDSKHISDSLSLYDVQSERAVYRLMNKQSTLVMVSTVSTSILWSIANVLYYFGSYLQVLIYLDITINCLCLFVMFSWNDKLYIKMCKPCSKLTDFCCSKIFESPKLAQIRKSLSRSKLGEDEKRKSGSIHLHAYRESEQFRNSKVFTSSPLSNEELKEKYKH